MILNFISSFCDICYCPLLSCKWPSCCFPTLKAIILKTQIACCWVKSLQASSEKRFTSWQLIQDMPVSFVSSLLVFHPLAFINLQTRRFLLNYTPPSSSSSSSVCQLVDRIYNCIRLHDSMSPQIISLCLHAADTGNVWRGCPPFIIIIVYVHSGTRTGTNTHLLLHAHTHLSSS